MAMDCLNNMTHFSIITFSLKNIQQPILLRVLTSIIEKTKRKVKVIHYFATLSLKELNIDLKVFLHETNITDIVY